MSGLTNRPKLGQMENGMSRKCACCDTQHNLVFVPDDEDYMCGECYCQQYHRYEFNQGMHNAANEIADGGIYDIQAAIDAFVIDPPSSAEQYGYLAELKSELESGELR